MESNVTHATPSDSFLPAQLTAHTSLTFSQRVRRHTCTAHDRLPIKQYKTTQANGDTVPHCVYLDHTSSLANVQCSQRCIRIKYCRNKDRSILTPLKGAAFSILGKCAYLLFCSKLDETIKSTLVPVAISLATGRITGITRIHHMRCFLLLQVLDKLDAVALDSVGQFPPSLALVN